MKMQIMTFKDSARARGTARRSKKYKHTRKHTISFSHTLLHTYTCTQNMHPHPHPHPHLHLHLHFHPHPQTNERRNSADLLRLLNVKDDHVLVGSPQQITSTGYLRSPQHEEGPPEFWPYMWSPHPMTGRIFRRISSVILPSKPGRSQKVMSPPKNSATCAPS